MSGGCITSLLKPANAIPKLLRAPTGETNSLVVIHLPRFKSVAESSLIARLTDDRLDRPE
jgi:hypothetical protein